MKISRSNILVGIVLLGSIAHVTILMNGFWVDFLWLTTAGVIGIPIAIHRYTHKKKRRNYSEFIAKENQFSTIAQ